MAKRKDIARTLMNIATVNSARGEYGNSLPRLNEALRNHQLLNDSMAVAACLANMASVYEHLEERDKAKNSYQAAIDIASIARHRAKVYSPSLHGLAQIATDEGRHLESIPLAKRALRIDISQNNVWRWLNVIWC